VVVCGLGDDFLVWFRLSSLLLSLWQLSFAWGSSSCQTGWILLLLLLFSVAGVIVSSTCLFVDLLLVGSVVLCAVGLSEVFVLCCVSLYVNNIVGDVLRRAGVVCFSHQFCFVLVVV